MEVSLLIDRCKVNANKMVPTRAKRNPNICCIICGNVGSVFKNKMPKMVPMTISTIAILESS